MCIRDRLKDEPAAQLDFKDAEKLIEQRLVLLKQGLVTWDQRRQAAAMAQQLSLIHSSGTHMRSA